MSDERKPMTDKEITETYAKTARGLLDQLCQVINQAKSVDGVYINFQVGPGPDGRIAVTSLTADKRFVG